MSDALALDRENLLSDAQVLEFIAQGYHLVEPQFSPEFNASICAQIDALESSLVDPADNRIPGDATDWWAPPNRDDPVTSLLQSGC